MLDTDDEVNLFETGNLDWLDDGFTLENPDTLPDPLKLTTAVLKRRMIAAMREEKLAEFWTALPEPGEALHIISNGTFDYWNFVPVALNLTGVPATEFYGSTWTMNRANALDLLSLIDAGRILRAAVITGLMFKRRETAVYTTIAGGMIERGQRFLCFENHAKVILLKLGDQHIVIEGSANFTSNPRVEQNVIFNDAELYLFHRTWMEKQLEQNGQAEAKQQPGPARGGLQPTLHRTQPGGNPTIRGKKRVARIRKRH